jgi:hypothetical protein
MRKTLVFASLALGSAALAAQLVPVDGRFPLSERHPGKTAWQSFNVDAPSVAAQKGDGSTFVDWPYGQNVVVGTSRYDYQHNGSYGKMIAVSTDGVSHGSFMGGINVSTGRRVRAWCVNPNLTVVPAADVMSTHAGYTTHAVASANPSNGMAPNTGVVGFHSGAGSWFGMDFGDCSLAFNLLQNTENADILWPHIAVDYNDKVHMVSSDSRITGAYVDAVWYNASTSSASWDGTYVLVTNASNTLSATMTAAKNAPGAAVVFGPDAPATPSIFYDASYGAGQWHHDVMVYEARDASNNVFARIAQGNPLNITKYHDPASTAPFRVGVFGYADMDAIYDTAETPNLHVAWPTPVSYADSLLFIDLTDDTYYMTEFSHVDYHSSIWHYNATTGQYGHIAGWLTAEDEAGDLPFPFSGVFRIKEDRVQLAHDPATGYLYALWNVYDKNDRRAPGADNKAMANGELYMACSADNGLTWGPRVNITQTPSPGCESPNCWSETFGSLAEMVDNGYLHLTFMLDLHAGASIRGDTTNDGGIETENNYYYMRIPVTDVPPHAGTPWNAEGHIGLSHYNSHRGVVWTNGALDSVLYYDRVCVFNEGSQVRHLQRLTMYHDMLDVFGTADLFFTWEVKPGDPLANTEWIVDPADCDEWNGAMAPQSILQVHLGVGRQGFPVRQHAFKFEFDDGTTRLYRYEYYGPNAEGSLVELIDLENLAQYESQIIYECTSDLAEPVAPASFALAQNVPNPFNPATEISFTLEKAGQASLKVHNLRGETVATLVNGQLGAGRHAVSFDGSQLSSGVYFYTLEAAGTSETRKMLLTK